MRVIGIITVAAALLRAQETPPAPQPQAPQPQAPAVLTNAGKPMTVSFQCTAEDIRSAGLDCSEHDPCPIYLELSAVESTGIRIFAAGNIHTASATLYSVLLGSDDNGHTWTESFERLRGAGLDHIQFSGAETGWISGQALYPLPRDPFLLQTNDGGKTWRQHPMFSEGRIGSLAQFWFEDAKRGSLIVDRGTGSDGDRYELYESQDGGDSWTIRQTSVKPLTIRRASVTSDWRVRTDGPSKSFHLEHREGTRWVSVGAFSVGLGLCKGE